MRSWVNLLPLFLVKRLARKHCEIVMLGKIAYHVAADGVLVEADTHNQSELLALHDRIVARLSKEAGDAK